MAESPENEPIPSSSEGTVTALAAEIKEDGEPLAKKRKTTECSEKLEHRLGGILCCAVCLDLPQAAVYQCSNGHLMCAPCFTHLLADARLRDEAATCPNCRIEISKTSASRNLAVEKTISELPSECKYCTCVFPRHSLQHHEENTCEERRFKFTQIIVDSSPKRRYVDSLVRIVASVYALVAAALPRVYLASQAPRAAGRRRYRRLTGCRYACLGCPWRGPAHELAPHAEACLHPAKRAADVLPALQARAAAALEASQLHAQVLDLLSYEKITFNDLQLKPYRTEEFVHKLFYETSRFSAFGHQWVVKAFVNKNQKDPAHSAQREITYQVILKSKPPAPLGVQWLAARGPWGEAGLRAHVAQHSFREDAPDGPPRALPLADPDDANRLLANKAIHFRLIMFLSSK